MKRLDESEPFAAELATAIATAERAGALIAGRWDQDFEIRHKGAVDLVTEVDLAAEAMVVGALTAAFPGDRILAEEGGLSGGTGGRAWFVDPLDGTTNFSHGVPHFAVSIGLWDDAGPAVGVIHDPIRAWTYWAVRGGGAWRDSRRLCVSEVTALPNALLGTGFPYDRRTNPDNNIHRVSHLLVRSRGLRRAGAAALDLAYVAAGWLDGFWEAQLSPWDIAAGVLLILEAGGTVTGLHGEPIAVDSGCLVATNGHVHRALVEAIVEADARFQAAR
jgi:myo-inositol-1(or 4)-monophosphatase